MVFGAHVAAFIIGAIEAGIIAVGHSGFWMQLTYGFITVLSVVIQINLRKRPKMPAILLKTRLLCKIRSQGLNKKGNQLWKQNP